jgi:hypothetical protein
MTEGKFFGWTNYETFQVALWLDRYKSLGRYWHDEVEAINHHLECSMYESTGIVSAAERGMAKLAEELTKAIHAGSPLQGPSLYAELLRSALRKVDWNQLTERLVADAAKKTSSEHPSESASTTNTEG